MNTEQECTISNGNRKWIAYLRVQHSEHSVHGTTKSMRFLHLAIKISRA